MYYVPDHIEFERFVQFGRSMFIKNVLSNWCESSKFIIQNRNYVWYFSVFLMIYSSNHTEAQNMYVPMLYVYVRDVLAIPFKIIVQKSAETASLKNEFQIAIYHCKRCPNFQCSIRNVCPKFDVKFSHFCCHHSGTDKTTLHSWAKGQKHIQN